MKKKNQKKKIKISKWIYVLFFATIAFCTLLSIKKMDNDIWYLLSEGRYIVQNGIYHIDPLSMHEGLQVVVQNWLSASILWIAFDGFGEMGILTLILICNLVIAYLVYKICMTITDDNQILSLITAFLMDIVLIPNYIVTRPQVFSFILLLSVILVLEKYIKTENPKILIWLPILSLIEANLHASLWWMIFLFTLPYIIDGIKVKWFRTQGYNLKPILLAVLAAFLVGFINPYGYKMMTFIFGSFGNKYMHLFISELTPFNFTYNICKHMFVVMLVSALCYVFFREGNVRVRYICLYCGTMILGFISIKAFSHFLLVAIFPLAYFFKDMWPQKFFDELETLRKPFNILFMILSIIVISFAGWYYCTDSSRIALTHKMEKAMDAIETTFDPDDTTIYVSFNDGGYVEYRGYKAYIDPRAEVFLKSNNKKEDIFVENYKLAHGQLDVQEFLDKYNFSLLLLSSKDYLFNHLDDVENYFIIYEDTENEIRLYAREDLFTEEEVTNLKAKYKAALAAAKAKADANTNTKTETN